MESCYAVPLPGSDPIDSGLFNVLAKGAEETSDDFLAPALYHKCAGQLGQGRTPPDIQVPGDSLAQVSGFPLPTSDSTGPTDST